MTRVCENANLFGAKPMKRNRLLCLAMLALLGIVSFSLYHWLSLPSHRINRETFNRIHDGMTVQQVDEVVGFPPSLYGCKGMVIKDRSGTVEDWKNFLHDIKGVIATMGQGNA